ncbi:MAG: THUMP domain-containing protein [Thermoplasmata archaeon]
MYFLISIRHSYLKSQVLTKILNFCRSEKVELLHEQYNGKILLDTGNIKYFLDTLDELSTVQEVHKINDFTDLKAIFTDRKFNTFAVRSNTDNSAKYNQKAGAIISEMFPDLKVDLKNPEVTVHLEYLGKAWYYFLKVS